ncbi:tetratricopeptide repeat protein [Lujinxingia sediminis]|uniref:Tetratricopeptide repeat protein n=1 Tax=Lujinxingia sediminis TaxID=2480984 RepID=A0ABY0CUY2_9DELT|nr:tetratricopeptide repeat protein [Lujinxingia sediminis]RVU45876.1 tetratricopeptide repeat protein [Lujinxingia sediminis]
MRRRPALLFFRSPLNHGSCVGHAGESGLRRVTLLLLVAAGVSMGSACTTGATRTDEVGVQTPTSTFEADPTLIRVRDGELVDTESLDSQEVFENAYLDFQARRYEDALENYRIIIDYFEESRFILPSLYNAGLALEHLEQWEDAALLYRRILDDFPESEESINASFRLGKSLHEAGRYEEVVEIMLGLGLRDLSHFDTVEAHVRRGNALLELEQWAEAEDAFQAAVDRNQRAPGDEKLLENSHFIVQAYFGLGESFHGRMDQVKLVLPTERMTDDLNTKADLHQSAQANYLRALRQHHPYWSVAAGYKIGRLYQNFYLDIFSAEIPDGLSEEQITLYFEELRETIRVVMERALSVYERNLGLARRIVQSPDAAAWIDATALHLERMRALLDDPMVHRRAEQIVLAGGSLEEELFNIPAFASEHVRHALAKARDAAREASPPAVALHEADRHVADRHAADRHAADRHAADPWVRALPLPPRTALRY